MIPDVGIATSVAFYIFRMVRCCSRHSLLRPVFWCTFRRHLYWKGLFRVSCREGVDITLLMQKKTVQLFCKVPVFLKAGDSSFFKSIYFLLEIGQRCVLRNGPLFGKSGGHSLVFFKKREHGGHSWCTPGYHSPAQ